MSTRIGKYIFEDDLENMPLEKLEYLRDACNHFIKEQHREEIHKALTEINLRAQSYGFDITVTEYNCMPIVLNELTMSIEDREE